jgi:hypothetical protein
MQAKKKPLPGESGETNGRGLTNHNEKLTTYHARRKRALLMRSFLRTQEAQTYPDLPQITGDLASCASYLLFHHYYRIDDTRLIAARTCKRHMLCPFCAARRASKTVERYAERLALVAKDNPGLKAAHLVLTVKNGPDLAERQAHLERAWKTLQKKRRDALQGKSSTELAKVAGAFFSYEVTNKGNGWHPHLHAVVLLGDWIDRDRLVAEWKAITGDSEILWLEKIGKGLDSLVDASGKLNAKAAEAFIEVAKYAVKFSDLTVERNWEAYQILRGRRLQGSFGLLRGVQVPDKLEDDPLQGEPYLELLYKHQRFGYDLIRSRDSADDR